MACTQQNPLPLTESRPLVGENGLTYWCMPAILCSLFLLFLLSMLTYLVMLWFVSSGYYCHEFDPFYCAWQGSFIYFLPWLAFTILAFNHLCLVWVSLLTTIGLSIVQPPSLTYASCPTSHHQTKKIILFACSLWHSYPLWCGCSLFPSLMACT